jgi:formyl-CoA transferase
VPSGAILSLEQALTQEQTAHRKTLASIDCEGIGELKLFDLTAKLEKTPGAVESPPPRLSAHTEEVLSAIGYSPEQVAELREAGVV